MSLVISKRVKEVGLCPLQPLKTVGDKGRQRTVREAPQGEEGPTSAGRPRRVSGAARSSPGPPPLPPLLQSQVGLHVWGRRGGARGGEKPLLRGLWRQANGKNPPLTALLLKTIPFSQGQRVWVSGEPYSRVSALVGAAQALNCEPAGTLPGLTARDPDPSGVLQTGPPRLFTHPPRASGEQSCVTFVTARPPAPGLYPQPYPRHSTIPRPGLPPGMPRGPLCAAQQPLLCLK